MFKELFEGILGLAMALSVFSYGKDLALKFIVDEAIPRIQQGPSDLHKFTKAMIGNIGPTALDDPGIYKRAAEGN